MVDGEQTPPPPPPPPHQRCTRSDGRKWRCKNPCAASGGTGGLCDFHYKKKQAHAKPRVSTASSTKKKGRPRKSIPPANADKGSGGDAEGEALEPEGKDSKGTDSGKVYSRRRKRADVEDFGKSRVYERRRKRENRGGSEKDAEGYGSLHCVNWEAPLHQCSVDNPTVKKGHQELPSHITASKQLHQGIITEGRRNSTSVHVNNLAAGGEVEDGDAVMAPSLFPSSPNIGDSAHQQSLLTQTQPNSCSEPPAPSASTSSMARKKNEGDHNMIVDVTLENRDIGGDAIASRSINEFSVSRCAEVLNEMTGFTPEELVKASEVFVHPYHREMFLSLKDELRRAWLRNHIKD